MALSRRLLREPRFSIFGRLTNEYIVDMFSRELDSRLRYVSANQEHLRMQEQDTALMGHKDLQDSENIYLPASFLGSGRWSSNQIADSLTLAAKYGPPTFFVTFTCNGEWPEIKSRLRPGQTFTDVPVVRLSSVQTEVIASYEHLPYDVSLMLDASSIAFSVWNFKSGASLTRISS